MPEMVIRRDGIGIKQRPRSRKQGLCYAFIVKRLEDGGLTRPIWHLASSAPFIDGCEAVCGDGYRLCYDQSRGTPASEPMATLTESRTTQSGSSRPGTMCSYQTFGGQSLMAMISAQVP